MSRHAQVNADNTFEKRERTGSRVLQVAQATEEQLNEDQQELETREDQKVEDARTCRIVHVNDKSKGSCHVQNELDRLMHHEGQELLSLWEGWWHWDDDNAPRQEVQTRSTFVATGCTQGSPVKPAPVKTRKGTHQDRIGKKKKGHQESPTCARGGSQRSTRRT